MSDRLKLRWSGQYLAAIGKCDGILVFVTRRQAHRPVLALRIDEVRRLLLRRLRKLGRTAVVDRDRVALQCRTELQTAASGWLRTLDDLIGSIVRRPLTPRQLETILGITGRERLRWSKDGRLRRAGLATAGGGQQFTIWTYSVEEATRLAGDPGIIAGWREMDTSV